jgi:hypothetical protein
VSRTRCDNHAVSSYLCNVAAAGHRDTNNNTTVRTQVIVNMLWQPAHTQAAASQSAGERNLVEGNQAYAETFTQGHLALPPSPRERSD